MAKGRKLSASYFRLVNPLLAIITVAIVAFFVVSYVDHKHICPEIFGPVAEYAELLANQYRYYLRIGLLVLAAIHLLETLVAVYKCYKYRLNTLVTLAWTVQTLLFGILSLYHLLRPSRPSQAPQSAPKPQQKNQGGKKQGGGGKNNNKAGKQNPQTPKASKSKKEK